MLFAYLNHSPLPLHWYTGTLVTFGRCPWKNISTSYSPRCS
jgi:hypothetical protein